MKLAYLQKLNLPDSPGVYFFQKGKETLYIGKATSLRSRVRSYFSKDLIATRGPMILDMVTQSDRLQWHATDSVLEALILEAELIKKHQPKYNTKEKDNKSFMCVVITHEDIPQVLLVRKKDIDQEKKTARIRRLNTVCTIDHFYGPFPSGSSLKEAMKIIRRIFPYRDDSSSKKDNYEFYHQLGLTPNITHKEDIEVYKKTIRHIKLFFTGKKKAVIAQMKKDMMSYAKKKQFEYAGDIKKSIFALEHINDVALIKDDPIDRAIQKTLFRIEAYDVAHMSGKNMVGVMTVIEDGQPVKNEYRKFIIRTQSGSNDTGALEEIVSRRLRHSEWGLPNMIVVDGSTAQANVATRVLDRYQFSIPVISVVKDNRHKAKALMGNEVLIKVHKKSILLANSEAHRFAIAFHREKRSKNMFV